MHCKGRMKKKEIEPGKKRKKKKKKKRMCKHRGNK